jgi:ABC-2 type transport system permease protein
MSSFTPSVPGSIPHSSMKRDLGLIRWQIRYEQRAYWRNRGRGVFTFVFPLMFLVIFGSLDKGGHVKSGAYKIAYDQFFVPGILAYGVIASTFVNIGMATAILRDQGVLKRMQGTPLPRWAYVAARIGSTAIITLIMTVVTLTLGALLYDVPVRAATLPGLLLSLLFGTAAFTTLGIGITRFVKSAESAPIVINLLIWPLTFISGIWFPVNGMPTWLQHIADLFPIKPLADGLQYAVNPHTAAPGISSTDLRALIIWTAIGIYLMLRFLRQPLGEVAGVKWS